MRSKFSVALHMLHFDNWPCHRASPLSAFSDSCASLHDQELMASNRITCVYLPTITCHIIGADSIWLPV